MKLGQFRGASGVVMRGSYGEGNLGDDALMLSMYAILRRVFEPVEITVALGAAATAEGARHAAQLLPGSATFAPHGRGARAGVAVWGGGTQWCSFAGTAARPPLAARAARRLRAPSKAVGYAASRLHASLRPPAVAAAIGVGVGPFADEARELASAKQLGRMQFLAVRDELSKAYCEAWGLADVHLGADLCFADPRWSVAGARSGADGTPRIGVIVRDWPHDSEGRAYQKPLLRTTAALRVQGARVDFISFSSRSDAAWRRELARSGESVIEWNAGLRAPEELLGALVDYDCLVSTRYHGTIFGALAGVPVVSVGIEPKLEVAADTIRGRVWRKPFVEADLLELVAAVLSDPSAEGARIAAAVEEQQRRAAAMASEFVEFLQASATEHDPNRDALLAPAGHHG